MVCPFEPPPYRRLSDFDNNLYLGRAFQDAPGQPTAWQQAAFDIISMDTESFASEAEAISVMDEVLRAMPGVETQTYDVYISHSACE